MPRELKFKIWEEQVRGPNQERGILPDDWRDPDRIQILDGLRIQVRDAEFRGHTGSVEPDWSQGWLAVDNSNGRVAFEGKGEPPWFVREALLNGLVLYGVWICRDEQRHGR